MKLRQVAPSAFVLGVPQPIAKLIPPGTEFACELIDQGLLYRPVSSSASRIPQTPPRWIKRLNHDA